MRHGRDHERAVQTHATDMLVLVLLATRVAGEWVEIAQLPHLAPSRRVTFSFESTTEAKNVYSNYSLTDPLRRTALPRKPNFGSVKRVQLHGKEKDNFSVALLPESTLMKEGTNRNGGYESMGPVRAPNIQVKDNIKTDKVNKKPNGNNFEKLNETNVKLHNPFRFSDLNTRKFYSDNPNVFNANTQMVKNKNQELIVFDKEVAATHQVKLSAKHDLKGSDIGILKGVQLSSDDHIDTKKYLKQSENNVQMNLAGIISNIDSAHNILNKIMLQHNNSSQQNASLNPSLKHTVKYTINKNANSQIKLKNATEKSEMQETIKGNLNGNIELNILGDNTKTNTVEILWKFMKVVADNISKNTRRSFRSKIRYLEDLRNSIMANIAERVEEAWPHDTGAEASGEAPRRKRAARSHVEFPSSESALMTISFLTFAVFLIKLVLQVIHTYKNKTMMVTPTVVAAVGRAAAVAAASLAERTRP